VPDDAVPGGAAPDHAVAPTGQAAEPARRRPGRLGAALASAAVLCVVALAGLWLGGYPGAAILAAATGLFTAAFSYRRRHRIWLELSRPWIVAGLLLVAALCDVAGSQLEDTGASGQLVTVLTSIAPQVICLAVVGRLAAALLASDH
jgi:arabinofuranan 3-O-arabinosyltransferase